MIRKVGEKFEYEGVTLRVEKDVFPGCEGCYFEETPIVCEFRDRRITGSCGNPWGGEIVKFVEVKEGGSK